MAEEKRDQGQYAGFATEAASKRRGESILKQAEHREQLLRKGLDTEVVDDPNYTPDLFRVQGLIQAGIWPEPQRASHLLIENGAEYDRSLATHMVALGFGTGEKARLLVLRPYRNEIGQLMLKGKVISNSPENRESEEKIDNESSQWGVGLRRTGIPWEYGPKHYNRPIEDLPVFHTNMPGAVYSSDIEGVKVIVDSLTKGILPVILGSTGGGKATQLDIPKDPFVFVNKSGRLAREESLHSLKAKAKSVIPGRKQNSLV